MHGLESPNNLIIRNQEVRCKKRMESDSWEVGQKSILQTDVQKKNNVDLY